MYTFYNSALSRRCLIFYLEISCLFAIWVSLVCPELTAEKNLILVLSLRVNHSKIYKTGMFTLIFTHWNEDLVQLDSGSSWFCCVSGEVSAKGRFGKGVMCGQVFPQVACLENCMRMQGCRNTVKSSITSSV